MAWIKHQKQTINGTEYEYWYVYKTYYEPGMDHPHQVKLGKVGESASELANCLREKGKDKGWDVSEDEIQELEETVKEAQEMAEDDEDIAEQIEKMSGETVETEDEEDHSEEKDSEFSEEMQDSIEKIEEGVSEAVSEYDDWSYSHDGKEFIVEGNGRELKIQARERYYAMYGDYVESFAKTNGFSGIHDIKKDGDKYLRNYGVKTDVTDFIEFYSEEFPEIEENPDQVWVRGIWDKENNYKEIAFVKEREDGMFSPMVFDLEKVESSTIKGDDGRKTKYDFKNSKEIVDNYVDNSSKRDTVEIIKPENEGEYSEEYIGEIRRSENNEDDSSVKNDEDEVPIKFWTEDGDSSMLDVNRSEVENYIEDLKDDEEVVKIKVESDVVYNEEDEEFDSMQAVKQLTRQGVIVERDAVDEIRPGDVERIESLDVTPMYLSASMLKSLRDHKGDISGSKTVDIDTVDIEYANVEVIGDVPEFMGMDGDVYGGYDGGEQVTLPDDNAEILVNRGLAERVEDEEDSSVKNDDSSDSSDNQDKEDDSMDTEDGYVEVEFLQKTPSFMGTDLVTYGGFEKGDVAEIPEDNAEILENRGNVEVKGGIANVAEEHNQSKTDKNGSDSSSENDSGELDKENLDRLRELIHELDDGDGANYKEVAEKEFVTEELIQNLLDLGDAYEPQPGKIKLLDFSKDSDTVSKEEVFGVVNDRDYDKFQEDDSVFAFNHKQTGKDIWFEGKESNNSGDNYIIYSDIVGVLQDNGVINGISPEKEYSDKEEALDELRLITMHFNNNYGEYLEEYQDEESVDDKDMRQLENKVVDYLDENFTEEGNGIKYETLKSRKDGIGNWMEINGFTEDMLEDAINNLLSDGTLYEPAPGRVKKL